MSQPTGRSRRQWEAFVELNSGKISVEELTKQMVADGLSEQEAQEILSKDKTSKTRGSIYMVIGGLVACIIGIVITISSYSSANTAASSGTSGTYTYYIWWGLIVFGAGTFFIGLFRLIFRRK